MLTLTPVYEFSPLPLRESVHATGRRFSHHALGRRYWSIPDRSQICHRVWASSWQKNLSSSRFIIHMDLLIFCRTTAHMAAICIQRECGSTLLLQPRELCRSGCSIREAFLNTGKKILVALFEEVVWALTTLLFVPTLLHCRFPPTSLSFYLIPLYG